MKNLGKTFRLASGQTGRTAAPAAFALLLIALLLAGALLLQVSAVHAQSNLSVEIIAGYNLVVDSNTSSPSTYAPGVATVMGRFCNNTGSTMTNVYGYIGDFGAGTPGVYPVKTDPNLPAPLAGSGNYSFVHLGGQIGTADAVREIGTLAAGECKVQYWHFLYPHCENVWDGSQWVWEDPPCSGSPVWGDSVKPDDDLSLSFDMWATADGYSGSASWTMTMRNEISAMANKIKPNPDGQWFNLNDSTVDVGDVITSNGILYELGNIRQGFDNDLDYTPDYNAWLQPIGDPTYDPTCFRLIHTSGVLTVSRSAGQDDLLIFFDDHQDPDPIYGGPLYFTNLPPDNNGVRGKVHYTFQALTGECTVGLSPYQEVASGFDNEKFNGDYGTGIPPVGSNTPLISFDKTGPSMAQENVEYSYSIPFANESTGSSLGLTLSSGGVNMPFTVRDQVPEGLEYVCGSASASLNFGTPPGYEIRYSTDGGATWSTSEPASCPGTNPLSTAANPIVLHWWLTDPIPKKTGSPSPGGTATFSATVPTGYIAGGGDPVIENCADARIDHAVPITEACAVTLIEGTASIGDFVWQDENSNGVKDDGATSGLPGVKVSLYWDRTGDGALGDDDVLISEQDTAGNTEGNYDFTQLPAGTYLVKVDVADTDIPTGYTLTTPGLFAVTLATGKDYNDADFGFGPTLRLDKALITPNPAAVGGGGTGVGGTVAFRIDLVNDLPGDGTANGYCTYNVWPSATETDSNANKQFANIANAIGAPNSTYASASFSTGGNQWMAGSTFSSAGRTSGVTSVQAVIDFYSAAKLIDDYFTVSLVGGATAWSNAFTTAQINNCAPAEGKKCQLTVTIPGTAAPGGSWDWADFDNPALKLQIDMNKVGSAEATTAILYVDALGFRVATGDTSCGGADTTINPLPLTDTYDSTYLQFLYAEPPASSQTAGTITWDNLGPLYAGGTKTVTVYFKALATIASPGTTNTASTTTAKFANGRDANDATDDAQVYIVTSFSLSGRTWIDAGGTLGWTGTTGYDPIPATDQVLPNVKMDLYVCVGADGLPIPQDTNRNTACGAIPTESWQLVGTKYTDYNGNYTFDGLVPGYYNVQANGKALPTGMTQRDGEASGAANGTGIGGNPCATCDGAWNEQALAVKNLSYKSANTTQVNFGYRNPTLGTVTGFVWHDQDQGGYNDWDSTEPPIPGTTVTLYCTGGGCGASNYTTTTDGNGYYQFSNLPVGATATYYVAVTPPGGMGQTADPNWPGPPASCYGDPLNCDNQTNTFTLAAGGSQGPDRFGYYGGLNVGDTVYVDWDGDGTQDSGEEGINGVVVYLYLDSNGNGVLDSGEPLLATQTTDSTGWYEFTNVAGGSKYVVVVNTSSLPTGYSQTGDPDESGTCVTCDSKDPLTLGSSDYLLADFGYRPRGFGSIGDYVWRDTDGDGIQDASESGVDGVVVNLYQDEDGDGVLDPEDALVDTDTTAGGGLYLFTDLPAGNYIVQVDSSNFGSGQPLNGLTLSTTDSPPYNVSQVSHQVALGDAEEYLDADFGFTSSAIGDTVWYDNNGDGELNAGEKGVPNVLVELWLDTDKDGVGDSFSTSTNTDSNGNYYFTGLPAGDYIVKLADSNFDADAVLDSSMYTQTYDPDASAVPCGVGECDQYGEVYTTTLGNYGLPLGQIDYSIDFGFQPNIRIGDTLWIDSDGNGERDPGETGIGYIDVNLWDCGVNGICENGGGDDVFVANTATDEDGWYTFGGLDDDTTYQVIVDQTDGDWPSNLTNTFDPDGTTDQQTEVVVSGGVVQTVGGTCDGDCSLDADFGYRLNGAYTLSGHTFFDNGDDGGYYSSASGDLPYESITVRLWNDSGLLLDTTTTDSSGAYSFTNLPNGNYYVSINPSEPKLQGLTMTSSPNELPGKCLTCNNYGEPLVTTINGANVTDVDFGFFASIDFGDLPNSSYNTKLSSEGPRHVIGSLYLGSSVDAEGDGQPTADATGDDSDADGNDDDGVAVESGMTWAPNATVYLDVSVTGSNGYLVGFFDWNSDGDLSDAGERLVYGPASGSFTWPVGVPNDASLSGWVYARFRLFNGRPLLISSKGLAYNGEVEDYRWPTTPTAVTLLNFSASPDGAAIRLDWETATEVDTLGFNLYRAESLDGPRTQLNTDLIPSLVLPGSPVGAVYTWLDETATPGMTYYYWLEDVDLYGATAQHGPAMAQVQTVPLEMPHRLFLPIIRK
jgi:hypothetical protein